VSGGAAASAIAEAGVIAILRGLAPERLEDTIESLAAGGIRAIELSLTTPGTAGLIARAAAHMGARAVIGAGTVLTVEDVRLVVDAGARFIVSPVFDPIVVEAALKADLLPLPGVFTPSEAIQAVRAGAPAVKLFPASVAGPEFVRSVRIPLPDLKIVPTGGVTLDLARAFAEAGAWAVAVGGPLVGAASVSDLAAQARAFVRVMRPSDTRR
jgi:2-dehydro-3-deoxyphosphogluconate aldolase/(4S)-4-hydroxy-2-oxoglutarate aldolase